MNMNRYNYSHLNNEEERRRPLLAGDNNTSSSSSVLSVGTASKSDAKKKKVSFYKGGESSPLLANNSYSQNVKGKNVYVFSDGTMGEDEGEEVELNTMRNRDIAEKTYKSTSSYQYEDVILTEIHIMKEDTLASLAIRFRCPVSELKRVNNLMTDKELHALKLLKIPIRSHQRLLQEEVEKAAQERALLASSNGPHIGGASIVSTSDEDEREDPPSCTPSSTLNMELHRDDEDNESAALLDRITSERVTTNDDRVDRKKYDKFMTRKDEDLGRIIEQVQQQVNNIDTVTDVMRTTSPSFPDNGARPPRYLFCIELTTKRLIILAVLTFVVLPGVLRLLYYVKYHS